LVERTGLSFGRTTNKGEEEGARFFIIGRSRPKRFESRYYAGPFNELDAVTSSILERARVCVQIYTTVSSCREQRRRFYARLPPKRVCVNIYVYIAYVALAAQAPEKLVGVEFVLLVGHDPRHFEHETRLGRLLFVYAGAHRFERQHPGGYGPLQVVHHQHDDETRPGSAATRVR